MFFGGNMGGVGGATFMNGMNFGGGTSPFGPMFVHSFHTGPNRQRPRRSHPEPPTSWIALALQIFPLILVAIIMFLNNSISTSHAANSDSWEAASRLVSLTPSPSHHHQFTTKNLGISYYATDDYQRYFGAKAAPTWGSTQELRSYERTIERQFISQLQQKCQKEERILQEKRVKASNDPHELARLQKEVSPSCERLHELGLHY